MPKIQKHVPSAPPNAHACMHNQTNTHGGTQGKKRERHRERPTMNERIDGRNNILFPAERVADGTSVWHMQSLFTFFTLKCVKAQAYNCILANISCPQFSPSLCLLVIPSPG
mmetsp:Transcript_22469/g.44506  ORF Transcript_22469/g.44506 Transcript_22469/m.44506 type:complete len:112 (-) Transcript_22469:441-776(-)